MPPDGLFGEPDAATVGPTVATMEYPRCGLRLPCMLLLMLFWLVARVLRARDDFHASWLHCCIASWIKICDGPTALLHVLCQDEQALLLLVLAATDVVFCTARLPTVTNVLQHSKLAHAQRAALQCSSRALGHAYSAALAQYAMHGGTAARHRVLRNAHAPA